MDNHGIMDGIYPFYGVKRFNHDSFIKKGCLYKELNPLNPAGTFACFYVSFIVSNTKEIVANHPTFNKKWTEPLNAKAFAQEMIKHTYREPWKLPGMPKARLF